MNFLRAKIKFIMSAIERLNNDINDGLDALIKLSSTSKTRKGEIEGKRYIINFIPRLLEF